MKSVSIISDSCSHNQHDLCNDLSCQCGCHHIARNKGLTPEEWKSYLARIEKAEESI
jgi:hypothetical protein